MLFRSIRADWNVTVDHALVNGIQTSLWSAIVELATAILQKLISHIVRNENIQEAENITLANETKPDVTMMVAPKMSELASSYIRLDEIYGKLQKQNKAIFVMEQERDQLVEEMNERKGLFKGKVRKQLQEKIDEKNVRIQNMKGHLVQIVKPYHYDTVNAFMKSYKAAKTEYEAYQVSFKNWNGGEESRNNSVVRKLQLGKEKIKEKDQTITGKKQRNESCR